MRVKTLWVTSASLHQLGSTLYSPCVPRLRLGVRMAGTGRQVAKGTSRAIVIDPFCMRQFTSSEDGKAPKIQLDPQTFEERVNEFYEAGAVLKDGYAPFCKHVFVPNFANMESATLALTAENEALLRTAYEARTEKELPVLVRYFPKEAVPVPKASWLDIILYSREQIIKENEAMGNAHLNGLTDAPWGIVSIKPQDCDEELPMQPITMMRNALGREYGGSGVSIDPAEYSRSVEFWSAHAIIK